MAPTLCPKIMLFSASFFLSQASINTVVCRRPQKKQRVSGGGKTKVQQHMRQEKAVEGRVGGQPAGGAEGGGSLTGSRVNMADDSTRRTDTDSKKEIAI
jgi:hypothetical protein